MQDSKNRRTICIGRAVLLPLVAALLLTGAGTPGKDYGVFTGLGPLDTLDTLGSYRTVVIDSLYFSEYDVERLHQAGVEQVYGSFSIGILEENRPYYDDFADKALDAYFDWSMTRWMDVEDPDWQVMIVDELAWSMAERGYDGFVIRDLEIYDQYPDDAVYEALCLMLYRLRDTYHLPVILDGGESFIARALETGEDWKLFDGVSRQSVFSLIDDDKNCYALQDPVVTEAQIIALSALKEKGLAVYLTEFSDSNETRVRIEAFCERNGYHVFFAGDKQFTRSA